MKVFVVVILLLFPSEVSVHTSEFGHLNTETNQKMFECWVVDICAHETDTNLAILSTECRKISRGYADAGDVESAFMYAMGAHVFLAHRMKILVKSGLFPHDSIISMREQLEEIHYDLLLMKREYEEKKHKNDEERQ